MCLLLCLLLLPAPAFATSFYPVPIAAEDGTALCCSKRYASCTGGPETCRKKECVTDRTQCEPPSPPPTPPPPQARSNGMELRADGRLTGPGVLNYEAYNRSGSDRPLTVVGIIFGRQAGQVSILKSTLPQAVIAAGPTRFSLQVSPAEYADWSRRFDSLTIAFSFPDERDGGRWEYVNLLTQDDVMRQPPGEFKVKGAFKPR